MTIFFNRQAKITIGETEIRNLDITFRIEKSLKKEPNSCVLEIYNLSETNRSILQEAELVPVQVEAGYKGLDETSGDDGLFLAFKGDLKEINSQLDGPDWVTTIQGGDGNNADQFARINKSFASGTQLKEMAKQLVEESLKIAGIDVGNAIDKLKVGDFAGAAKEVLFGTALSGNAFDELDKILKNMGLEGSIQDNELQLLDLNQPNTNEVVNLNANSGLLGSPEPKNNGIIVVRSLLQPGITPGSKVNIISKSTNEAVGILYRVEKVTYIGSTFGEDWFVEFEGKQLESGGL